jgi:putative ABC transport system substrate-binding protein
LDRRRFIGTLVSGFLAAPVVGETQSAGKVPRIGYLTVGSAENDKNLRVAFVQGLADLGYLAGKNIAIVERFADGHKERVPELAAELAQSNLDVVVVSATALYDAKSALVGVPTIFVIADDPVRAGLVASLARPAGHMTGLSSLNIQLDGKRLEILQAALPAVRRVGLLLTSQDRAQAERVSAAERAARSLGLRLSILQVPSMDRLPHAIDAAVRSRVEALMIPSSAVFRGYQAQTAQLVTKTRLPVVSAWREFPEAGGFLSYGTSVSAMFHRAAAFVDKILKGAKPADLPVEQATKFELVINLKTANALGLTIPPSLLQRADQVIE